MVDVKAVGCQGIFNNVMEEVGYWKSRIVYNCLLYTYIVY